MKNSFNASKVFYTIFLVAALILLVPAINYVGIALGWTNPIQPPPGGAGAIYVDDGSVVPGNAGNVGIGLGTASSSLTVQGEISAAANRIRNVATPVNGDDAVNKDYVDAASGSGGTITIFGVSSSIAPYATFSKTMGFGLSTISNCAFGNFENCGPYPFASGIPVMPGAGQGATCPSGYTSIFAGYGPYSYVERNYYDELAAGGDDDAFNIGHESNVLTDRRTAQSYSVCGTTYNLAVKTDYSFKNGAGGTGRDGTGAVAGIASACVPQQLPTPPMTKYYVCNTCRICEKD